MDKIDELLSRGVDNIYPTKEDLEKLLKSGKKLKLYQGFDPTGTQLHIGHMVGLMKLRDWQKAGHEVIFLIGDGTGQAGDPSGKKRTREKFLSNRELRENALDYVKQAAKIVKFDGENPVKILYNGDWLNKLNLKNILEIAGHFSVQQLLERDLYQERLKNNEELNFREFLYPLLQGYDSVAMQVDLELGGSDQMFNMLVGRKLVRDYLNKDKFVMTTPLLTDSEGRKIGKTEGNVISLTDTPENLFGKLMTLPDDVIIKGFTYLTRIPMSEVEKIKNDLENGKNPVIYKKQLAFTIIKMLNDEESALKAQKNFEKTVQNKEIPDDMPTFNVNSSDNLATITDLLLATQMVSSRSEAKRLIEQGGVELDGEKITETNQDIQIDDEVVLKAGKRKFVRITNKG